MHSAQTPGLPGMQWSLQAGEGGEQPARQLGQPASSGASSGGRLHPSAEPATRAHAWLGRLGALTSPSRRTACTPCQPACSRPSPAHRTFGTPRTARRGRTRRSRTAGRQELAPCSRAGARPRGKWHVQPNVQPKLAHPSAHRAPVRRTRTCRPGSGRGKGWRTRCTSCSRWHSRAGAVSRQARASGNHAAQEQRRQRQRQRQRQEPAPRTCGPGTPRSRLPRRARRSCCRGRQNRSPRCTRCIPVCQAGSRCTASRPCTAAAGGARVRAEQMRRGHPQLRGANNGHCKPACIRLLIRLFGAGVTHAQHSRARRPWQPRLPSPVGTRHS